MEDVLDLYALALDDEQPVVCFDESPYQLLADTRTPLPAAPGPPRRQDFEYERAGVADVMMICQPAAGLRKCLGTQARCKSDFARACLEMNGMFPKAKRIRLVLDNLSVHTKGAFYKAFEAPEARRLAERFEFHFTPKHGSWLNVAELEIAVLGRGVFKKSIRTREELDMELKAACAERNAQAKPVKWMFTSRDARKKMSDSYLMPASRSH